MAQVRAAAPAAAANAASVGELIPHPLTTAVPSNREGWPSTVTMTSPARVIPRINIERERTTRLSSAPQASALGSRPD